MAVRAAVQGLPTAVPSELPPLLVGRALPVDAARLSASPLAVLRASTTVGRTAVA